MIGHAHLWPARVEPGRSEAPVTPKLAGPNATSVATECMNSWSSGSWKRAARRGLLQFGAPPPSADGHRAVPGVRMPLSAAQRGLAGAWGPSRATPRRAGWSGRTRTGRVAAGRRRRAGRSAATEAPARRFTTAAGSPTRSHEPRRTRPANASPAGPRRAPTVAGWSRRRRAGHIPSAPDSMQVHRSPRYRADEERPDARAVERPEKEAR